MIQHPAEGTLQAYLDGEVLSESREALDRHMDGCHECQEALAQLDVMADATGAALARVDLPAPATDAARWDVRRARAARRSRRIAGGYQRRHRWCCWSEPGGQLRCRDPRFGVGWRADRRTSCL